MLWESVALTLAAKAGIAVPAATLEDVAGKPVLILTRFDRNGARRIPFLSAMSMLGARDNETRSYLEVVDALRQHGAAPREDMEGLWRRIVFSVLISNTDDHLRNHAFLYEGQNGWRLSPAYDLNPVPTDIKPRVLTTAITEDDTAASLDLVFRGGGVFRGHRRASPHDCERGCGFCVRMARRGCAAGHHPPAHRAHGLGLRAQGHGARAQSVAESVGSPKPRSPATPGLHDGRLWNIM